MQRCSKCGHTFEAESRPICDDPTQVPTRLRLLDIDKTLKKYVILMLIGLFC